LQTTTLLDAIEEFKFDACIGGHVVVKKSKSKERIFLFVMILVNGTKNQRPELFDL
jgi:sulfate adenylyltransferase subunit 2